VLAHIGMWGTVIAALGLIRFAIGGKGSWWQLILILLTLGGIATGMLWVLGAGGLQLDRHVGPAPIPSVSASPAAGIPAGIKSSARRDQPPRVSAARARAQASAHAAPGTRRPSSPYDTA